MDDSYYVKKNPTNFFILSTYTQSMNMGLGPLKRGKAPHQVSVEDQACSAGCPHAKEDGWMNGQMCSLNTASSFSILDIPPALCRALGLPLGSHPVQAFQVMGESWRSQNSINLGGRAWQYWSFSVCREGACSFLSLKPGSLVASGTDKLHALSTALGKRWEAPSLLSLPC